MKKQLLFAFACTILFSTSYSQEVSKVDESIGQSSFFAEVGGAGILFSANFDSRFKKSHLGLGGRIGLGFVTQYEDKIDPVTGAYLGGGQRSVVTVPFQINYLLGKSNSPHVFEVGAGLTWLSKKVDVFNFYDSDSTNLMGTFSFMYRRQPRNGGFSWRIGFTPIISNGYIQPSAGASVGFNF